MPTREERLAQLLQRWEEAWIGQNRPEVETFCASHECTDLIEEFSELVEVFAPLKFVERTARDGAPIDDEWTPPSRFRVAEVLGVGGLGVVYKAEDIELEREVALKRLQRAAAEDPDARDRFIMEAKLTGRLNHPGVVPVHSLASGEEGDAYYTMRIVTGESLQEAVNRFHSLAVAPWGERNAELRRLLRSLGVACETVAFAHSKGVIHRDLKPQNIMLGGYGETLVIDWGLAKLLERGEARSSAAAHRPTASSAAATVTGQVMGTWAYMSPEQAKGDWGRVGPASDIFSLGATLYQILVGRAPYGIDDIPVNVVEGRFAPPRRIVPTISSALEAVCLKAMASDPHARYADARELARDVEHWLADEPVSAYRDPIPVRFRRWTNRNRSVVSAGLMLLFTAIIALGAGLFFVNRERDRTDKARQDTEYALIRESQQKERAELAYSRVRSALDTIVGDGIEPVLARRPAWTRREQEMFRKLLTYYQDYVRELGSEKQALEVLAFANLRIGMINIALGNIDDADRHCRDGFALFETLIQKEDGRNGFYKAASSDVCYFMGLIHTQKGSPAEATAWFQRSVEQRRGLVARQPESTWNKRQLADALNDWGASLAAQQKGKEAAAVYAEAAELERAFVSRDPRNPSALTAAIRVLINQGEALVTTFQGSAAENAIREGRQLLATLLEISPKDFTARHFDASLAVLTAQLSIQRFAFPPAEQLLLQARSTLRELARDDLTTLEHRDKLVDATQRLAVVYGLMGRREPMIAGFEDAIGAARSLLLEFPKIIYYRKLLLQILQRRVLHVNRLGLPRERIAAMRVFVEEAAMLLERGDLVEFRVPARAVSVQLADAASKLGDAANVSRAAVVLDSLASGPEDRINAARTFGRAAHIAHHQSAAPGFVRAAQTELWSRRAIALLRNSDLKAVDDLKKHDDFAYLRTRSDFQQFIAETEARLRP